MFIMASGTDLKLNNNLLLVGSLGFSVDVSILIGCDLAAVDRCMKMLDFSKLNMSDPDSYPTFCGDSNSVYTPFEECYNTAAPPCSDDLTFMNSQIESIAISVSMVCLSSDDCNYMDMSKCGFDMGAQLSNVAPIPNTDTYNGLCSTSEKFIECMDPILTRCEKHTAPKLPYYHQSKQIMNFVLFNCYHSKEELLLHSTCLDKPSTSEALAQCTISEVSDDICQQLAGYVDCVYNSVWSTCNQDSALVAASFAEVYGKNTTQESLGTSCNLTKYSQVTTTPNMNRQSTTAAKIETISSLRPSPIPTTQIITTRVLETTTKILTTKLVQKTSALPTTTSPTTPEPTTRSPTTHLPSTMVPTTKLPTTRASTTRVPTTHLQSTQEPTTRAPTTRIPTTNAPTTQLPTSLVPTTRAQTTSQNIKGSTEGKVNNISSKAVRKQTVQFAFIIVNLVLLVFLKFL